MNTINRNEKVTMFLNDYYFGFGNFIMLLRIIGGPLLVLFGYNLYNDGFDKFSIAYSGFCIVYGIYLIIRPYLWILIRLENYNTEEVVVEISENEIKIRDNKNESRIDFSTLKKISSKQKYFLFVISKSQRIRIPKKIISLKDQSILIKQINE